ncbi:MAG: iron-containing alcohol dehydrogenase [Gemmatales bacterium]|nr:iron-containing alcohol dehydrogenase [Gemmatales bacterium]MDW8386995.1 iron-containing alcohol dehydrogenase [Gemmatales bacterium]
MKAILQAFDFHPQTRIVFGPGSINRLGELTRELGGRRVLVVTDPGLEQAGHPQKAVRSLEEAGLSVTVFDQVEENPTTFHVEAGLRVARQANIDFLVAVGGGSAMDVAKGINFLFTNGGKMADYWGNGKATKPMLPSIGVPTTAGTGSEAQSYALIADPKTHLKMACGDRKAAFRVAVLDPEVTLTQPPRVTADTGMDAISHALEAYVTTRRNPLAQALAREAWRLLAGHFERVLHDPSDLDARAAMQLGAHLAGMAIENSMLGATHALANPITAHYGITHGQAIGLMLPHVIRFNSQAVGDLYADLLREVHQDNGRYGDAGKLLAERVEGLARAAGLPARLSDLGINAAILPVLAEEASQQWTGRFNPRPVSAAELLTLYQTAY